ncbi:hypothetical protein EYZ11_013393 [Aspergillus tanneri]|uniref:Uncharacterized protein n=1 Tax=Aspergillus tanneri TaxID=1220188 RepID=A0A4S3IZZ1_9EURO|nr:hypothetical protein EYZ11_013393 [Aspergillus tanneri]
MPFQNELMNLESRSPTKWISRESNQYAL